MLQTNLIQNAHADLICDASYNFYGTRLATGGLDQRIKVWRLDEQTGEWSVEDEWKAHDAAISRLAWAHPQHGQFLASASFDRTVKIWERLGDIVHTPGNASLGVAGGGGSSDRWVERALLSEAKGSVRGVEWAPTAFGMRIATISSDHHLRIYECLETGTAAAPGGPGGTSTGLNAAANSSAATPPDSALGISVSGPAASVLTPGRGFSAPQPWTLTWSPMEDIDVSTLALYTAPVLPASPTSQNAALATAPGSESTAALDITSGVSFPGGSASPFIGAAQSLATAPSGSGSNAAPSNQFSSSPALGGTALLNTGTGGSPGNTASSGFSLMLGSPPVASVFSGLGTSGSAGSGATSGAANASSTMAGPSGTNSVPKVGGTTYNREADGGWDLSWCKDSYWGEVCAAVAGGNGIIKIIHFQAGQRPRCVLFLDPRPSSPTSADALVVTPTATPHLRAQQSGSQFLSPHAPPANPSTNHPRVSPRPSPYATTSVAWAPSCGRSYHLIAAGSRDGRVRIWKVRPPPLTSLNGEDGDDTEPESEESEGEQQQGDGGINNKNTWSASIVADFEDHASSVGRVAWNITGTVLTSAGNDGRVRLWRCTYGNVWRPMGSLDVIQDEDAVDEEQMED